MTADTPARPPLDETRLADVADWRVEVLPEADSTNAVVAARAAEPEGLVVVAEHQVAGRGRLDRSWQTPARAALTFSVLLRPDVPVARWPWLPLVAGYAVSTALREIAGPEDATGTAALKWPNDVLVGDRKVAGVLVELVGDAAVAGIGLNVSTTAAELAGAGLAEEETTSLALAGVEIDRTELLVRILGVLRATTRAWADDPGAFAMAYQARCATLGREVHVALPGGASVTGTAVGVDEHGRLLVGETAIAAGDVLHVRPHR